MQGWIKFYLIVIWRQFIGHGMHQAQQLVVFPIVYLDMNVVQIYRVFYNFRFSATPVIGLQTWLGT